MSDKINRFGGESLQIINEKIKQNVPINTVKSKRSIWGQFSAFCGEKNYVLDAETPTGTLADILKDWAFNMKRSNGDDYKESVVKTMWNQTAKLLQEKYFSEFKREIDPFSGPIFQEARAARNAKRRLLQSDPQKRMKSATALDKKDMDAMMDIWDEETPEGLQKKLFIIVSVELAWRGGEGVTAMIHHFRDETGSDGKPTGRIEYNPIFTKTTQGGDKKCASSKWLIPNEGSSQYCPVRLLRKFLSKRNSNVKTDRLFLTVNPYWQNSGSVGWYKDVPVGRNLLGKWINEAAKKAGLDTTGKKITNHSSRATAVSNLAKSGVGEQQILKITGHSNVNSIKTYLQLDQQHHEQLVKRMRQDEPLNEEPVKKLRRNVFSNEQNVAPAATNFDSLPQSINYTYNNCTFHCSNLHMHQ